MKLPYHPLKMPNHKRQGFTLIELMLVTGIIAVLAGVISSALDIPLMLVNTRDAERKQNVKTIENAMYQHLVDEWELANGQNIPEGEENAKEICIQGLTIEEANAENCVQLDALVDKDFIAALPRDPLEPNEKLTGYTVYKHVGRPRIVAVHLGALPGDGGGQGIITWETDEEEVGLSFSSPGNAAALDSDTFVVVWGGLAKVGTVNGNAVVWDTSDTIFSTNVQDPSVLALDNQYFVVSYRRGNSPRGVMRVGSFDGNSISWVTSEYTFETEFSYFPYLAAVDNNTFIMSVDRNTQGGLYLKVFTVNVGDGTITEETGWVNVVASGPGRDAPISMLDSDTFAIAYSDSSDSFKVNVRIGTIDYGNDTINWDTSATIIDDAVTGQISALAGLDSDTFIVGSSNELRIGTVNGGAIQWDTSVIQWASSSYAHLDRIDADSFAIAGGNMSSGMTRFGTFRGGDIVWDTDETEYTSTRITGISIDMMTSTRFILNYHSNNDFKSYVRIGNL